MLRTCVALRNRPWETYVAFATCVALVCVASPAHAQSCTYVGAQMYCSNGLTSNSVGNTTYYNNGTIRQSVGPTDYYSRPFAPAPVYTPSVPMPYTPPAIRR